MTARQALAITLMRRALRAYELAELHQLECRRWENDGWCDTNSGQWYDAKTLRRRALPDRKWRTSELALTQEDW